MLSVKIVVVGNLKEEFFRAAEAEYLKRLGGFCKIEVVQLKEERRRSSTPVANFCSTVVLRG